jgi:hypothetical protein
LSSVSDAMVRHILRSLTVFHFASIPPHMEPRQLCRARAWTILLFGRSSPHTFADRPSAPPPVGHGFLLGPNGGCSLRLTMRQAIRDRLHRDRSRHIVRVGL